MLGGKLSLLLTVPSAGGGRFSPDPVRRGQVSGDGVWVTTGHRYTNRSTVGRPLTASTRSCAAAAAAGAAAAAVAGAVAGAAGAADGVAGAAAGAAVGVHVGAVAVTATVAEAAARQATLYQEQLRPIVGSDSWRTVFCALPPFYLMIIVSAAIHNVAIHNNWAKMVVCWV